VLTHIHPSAPRFASKVATLFIGPTLSEYSCSYQVPRAPSHVRGVTSHVGTSRVPSTRRYPAFVATTNSCANPTPSLRLDMSCTAGRCRLLQPLLGIGPSRRYLCESFSACLNPYPGCPCGALAPFFPQDNGLPGVGTPSALGNGRTATSVQSFLRGCSYSFIFRPADLLAPHVAPTAVPLDTRQTGLLHPRISQFVTSPSRGYANRPLSGN
jgi:hypothetical protein